MDVNSSIATNTTYGVTSAKGPQVYMDIFLASAHFVCALFGIPLNLRIIFFILSRRRLHTQPCNTILIGIGIANVFVLVNNIFELIGFTSPEATELCRVRFFLAGLPVVSLLTYKLFSLVERYLFIFHSVLYRRYVTARFMSGIQFGAFILVFLMTKSHYIFGLIKVKCNVTPPLDRAIYFGFIFFFVILCLVGQLTLCIMLKIHLVLPSANVEQLTNGGYDTSTNTGIETVGKSTENIQKEEVIVPEAAVIAFKNQIMGSCHVTKQNLQYVTVRDQTVNRLELEATKTVILSVGLLLIFASTWIISSVLALNCHGNVIHPAMDEEETAEAVVEQCGRYYWAISYTRMVQLVALSIYQSVSYVMRSRILCSALGQS